MERKHTFGIWIERGTRFGTTYVEARVMVRRDDAESPINGTSLWDGELPAHLKGCDLEGLGVRGFVTERGEFLLHAVDYSNIFSIDAARAARMVKTLAKISRAIERESASEPGDIYMALVRALKLEWCCIKREGGSSTYSENRWTFLPAIEGRDIFRREIATACGPKAEVRA